MLGNLENTLRIDSGKSPPTAATRRTAVKKLAAAEKYVHDPPSTFSACPLGVTIVSIPTVPVTMSGIGRESRNLPFRVGADRLETRPGGFRTSGVVLAARSIMDALRSIPEAISRSDGAYLAAFDAQRTKVLRTRIRWYAILAIVVLAMGILGNIRVWLQREEPPAELLVQVLSNTAMITLFAGAFYYIARLQPDRRRLVQVLTILTVAALAIGMSFEVIIDWTRADAWRSADAIRQAKSDAGIRVTLAYGIYFALASVLVPMTVRESIRIALTCFAVFVLVVAALLRPPAALTLWLILFFTALTAPGMAWSWWRYREFDARFQADTFRERYSDLSGEVREISAELSQARRLHEALFPPEIAAGPVRLAYRYEPMREIGGDFLYIHHNAIAQSLLVAIIDVSGHGIPAALAVNRLHGELQRSCAARPDISPALLLADLNTYALVALAPQGVYATAIVIRVDPALARVEWASAGHPTAFLRAASGDVRPLPATATMLGIIESERFEPAPQSPPFRPAELLLAYTDGASETRDARGQDFSMARIRQLVELGAARGLILDQVHAAVIQHRHGRITDDTLIVEIAMNAASATLPSIATIQASVA